MVNYSILLLPLIALALVFFFPLFSSRTTVSRSWKSRRRRWIYLGRILVAVLLLSTVATLAWPLDNLGGLMQGVLITAGVMLPVCLGFLTLSLRYALKARFSDGPQHRPRASLYVRPNTPDSAQSATTSRNRLTTTAKRAIEDNRPLAHSVVVQAENPTATDAASPPPKMDIENQGLPSRREVQHQLSSGDAVLVDLGGDSGPVSTNKLDHA